MPELPEVQTVVSQLGRKVAGKTIASFRSDWKKKVLDSYPVFVRKVRGARIQGARRLGKHVVLDLDNGYSVVIHLKMTGHLLYKDEKNWDSDAFTQDPINGFVRHAFTFADGSTLEFSDMRKFGWLRAVKTGEVPDLPGIAALGVDALSPELTQKHFRALLEKKKRQAVGTFLLDQGGIAGVGNIYRSEALFRAGIQPTRPIGSLSEEERGKILPALRLVLRKAVELRGTSDGDFRDTDGLPGTFQRTLYVYRRTGMPCKRCGTMIKRKKIGQRSVFYCPRCQK